MVEYAGFDYANFGCEVTSFDPHKALEFIAAVQVDFFNLAVQVDFFNFGRRCTCT